ncbi:hypothetical protein PsorP6_004730 [Peronosclerospora sorghi]|uniref:Uncharacterized protein n=1 Tax=Peronosclerospora sorghi TaxID=230839 RepID=A0ACC0VSC6_9STRA|nr:hypothetical protein PsorP6_004730 [Peronosclerospora sorghi]
MRSVANSNKTTAKALSNEGHNTVMEDVHAMNPVSGALVPRFAMLESGRVDKLLDGCRPEELPRICKNFQNHSLFCSFLVKMPSYYKYQFCHPATMSDELTKQLLRCQQLVDKGALRDAVNVAHECVVLDKMEVRGFLLLTEALSRQNRHEDAVAWYKTGLEIHPDNEKLLKGLKEARVAVLNELLEQSDESDEEALNNGEFIDQICVDSNNMKQSEGAKNSSLLSVQSAKHTHTHVDSNKILINKSENSAKQVDNETQDLVFKAKMERVLESLDVLKLARLAAVYACSELLNLRRVAIGLGFFFFGLLTRALIHRQTIMLISMLVICIYRSRLKERVVRFAQDWVNASTDKLGALAWGPRVEIVIPLLMKIFGQVQFMLFLQQDVRLICVVLMVTAMLVANSLRTLAGEDAKLWGEGRRLKLAAYVTALMYWVVWRGEWTDTLRLLGPVFIDSGGIILGSVTSFELQEVCRRVFKRLFNDVANDIQTDVDLDVWFFLGLGNWIVEYWQQPTDFSLEMLSKMLSECLNSMEKAAMRTFGPELRQLRNQVKKMEINDELQLLIAYFKQSLKAVSPPKMFGMAVLFAKRCPSFVVFGLLATCFRVISLPLMPFLMSEFHVLTDLYESYEVGAFEERDGLELMLLDSPLLHVWTNVKGCFYCLEGGVVFSKAVATGTHILSAAARIRSSFHFWSHLDLI